MMPRKKDILNPRKQISISLPVPLLASMDLLIDGSHVRNRTHLIHIAVVDYMARVQIHGLPEQLTIADVKPKKPVKAKK